jgi:zinc-ribbon domain
MFCTHCGAPNPGDAAFCSACGKAVAAPPAPAAPVQQQPQAPAEPPRSVEPPRAVPVQAVAAPLVPVPPRRRSHVLRNLALVAVLITAVIVVAIALAGPSPQTSLEKAGAALINRDQQAFDNYVDVQSILGDWTDQAAGSWLSNNNSAGNALVANGLVAGFKSLLLPKLASSVEQEILSHQVSDQPQTDGADNTANNYMTSFLSNGIHTLITSQLQYRGIAAQTKAGAEAMLDVRFATSLSSNPFIVQVRMQRVGDHWRIVAIPDVAHLLAQLQAPPNASSQSSQTGPQGLADLAKKPLDTAPQPPAIVPSPPPAAERRTEEPAAADDPIGEGGFITPPTR